MLTMLTLTILAISSLMWYAVGYNIEVNKAGIAWGEPGTQFGYTVAVVRKPGWKDPRFNPLFHEKVLLIGTPNRTVNMIPGYGGLMRCDSPLSQNVTCSNIDMTEKAGICKKLKGIASLNRSDCERDQRMGATVAVNRKFPDYVYTTSTLPMVTVCGPGWRNVLPENTETSQNYMIGICLKLREALDVLSCPREFSYCWPFWTFQDKTFYKGQPFFAYAQGGVSAAFSQNGKSELIGAPGVSAWRGGYKFIQTAREYLVPWTQENTLYCGYSIATAEFHDKKDYVVVGCPNYYTQGQGHTGKVEILNVDRKRDVIEFGVTKSCDGIDTLKIDSGDINKDQVGTKFGAAVYTVDITGDGSEEIFIGAPYYSSKYVEEGRVFVYTMKDQTACGPIAILSGGAKHQSYKDKVEFARFGTSITSAGDLNRDDLNDVVIGSPYEDGGKGAVYIYHGHGSCSCIMEDKFSQRISGESIDSGLRGFGWSLYGDEDIDDNGYPDLLVGAYSSDSAVILRTRPIVDITGEMDLQPNPIPLKPDSLPCSKDGMLCFLLTVQFYLQGPKNNPRNLPETTIFFELDADTLYKASGGGASRVVFRKNGKSILKENITIQIDSPNTRTYNVDVLKYKNKTEPRDAWKKIRIEGNIHLIESNVNDFNKLDPILYNREGEPLSADIEFDIKCESVEKCSSDLDTQVRMSLIGGRAGNVPVTEETAIFLDYADELQIETDIKNLVNSSYRAKFTSNVNADLKWHRSSAGKVGATCKSEKKTQLTWFNCSADSIKLDQNDNFKVTAHFDISRESLITGNRLDTMKESVDVWVMASQEYKDLNPSNNVFEKKIPVRLKYDIDIYENTSVSDAFRYKGDPTSNRVFNLRHIYYIRNNGPSFLPRTYVNISVPIKKGEVIFASIKGYPSGLCQIAGSDSQKQTTKAPTFTMSTTETITIGSPETNRRKRDTNQKPMSQTDKKDTSAKMNITCDDPEYQCQVIECLIEEIETSDKPEIEVTIDVYEKALAKEKGILEVHYNTEAHVTDPAVWFSGKVVPWQYAVSAEKTTLFVVEQATIIDEIDLWIIFVSIGGALLLLIIVIIILWKCGFFKRKKHQEVQKWKQDSLYKRRSQMPSTITPSSEQPYSPIDTNQS